MGRLNITINDELIANIDYYCDVQKLKNRSEFLEKALIFYLGYIETSSHTEYLNASVSDGVRKGLNDIERQTMPNIFRLSVELSMLTNIIASGIDMSTHEIRRLRSDCVKAVRATNRRTNLEHANNYQNDLNANDKFYDNFTGQIEIEDEY